MPTHSVYVEPVRQTQEHEWVEALSRHTEVLNRPIELHNGHSWEISPQRHRDNRLYIHNLSSPGRTSLSDERLTSAYGYPVNGSLLMRPTSLNPVIGDEDGVILAEYHQDNLYLLFDILDSEESAMIIDRILTDLEVSLHLSAAPAYQPNDQSRLLARLKRAMGVPIDRVDFQIRNLDNQLLDLRRQMLEKMVEHRILTSQKSVGQKIMANIDEAAIAEIYSQLQSLSANGAISLFGDEIHIPLGPITIVHESTIYDIGSLVLSIHISGNNGGITCLNETRQPNGYHHPSVQRNGRIYLGRLADSVAKLIGELDIVTAAAITIEYLHSYDPREAIVPIENWPKKE